MGSDSQMAGDLVFFYEFIQYHCTKYSIRKSNETAKGSTKCSNKAEFILDPNLNMNFSIQATTYDLWLEAES